MDKSVFEVLFAVDCTSKVEKKNGLSYLPWAWAWAEVKKRFPNATYRIYESEHGWNYFTDGRTAWVKTGVTINDMELIEYLPVMDFRNNSIPAEKITSFDVNKAIQRSLTKACARHGLGLYIYAGEDLPEEAANEQKEQEETALSHMLKLIDECKTSDDVMKIWKGNRELQRYTEFAKAIKEKGSALKKAEQQNQPAA